MIGDIDLLISHFILFLLGNYYYLQVVVEASDQKHQRNEFSRERERERFAYAERERERVESDSGE